MALAAPTGPSYTERLSVRDIAGCCDAESVSRSIIPFPADAFLAGVLFGVRPDPRRRISKHIRVGHHRSDSDDAAELADCVGRSDVETNESRWGRHSVHRRPLA